LKKKFGFQFFRDDWFQWDGNRFVEASRSEVRAAAMALVKATIDNNFLTDQYGNTRKTTPRLRDEAIAALQQVAFIAPRRELPFWTAGDGTHHAPMFALMNGLIPQADAIAGTASLQSHTQDYFNVTVFPFEYIPGATAPRWERFLEQMLEGDPERIAIIQELFGYVLTPGNTMHKFFLLEGSGANGKSVVLQVLEGLVGKENISAVPLGLFGHRFQLWPTVNKLLNIAPEADENDRPDVGLLKQFVGGDSLTIDRKGVAQITVRATAKLVIAANSRPKFLDSSEGLWRRLVAIPFRVVIPEAEQDKHIASKLLEELPGIFNWALIGLQRLQSRGVFTESELVRQAVAAYKLESNPARLFLTEYGLEAAPESEFVVFPELYAAYVHWCIANGHKKIRPSTEFGKEVTAMFPDSETKQRTVHGARGVRVRTGLRSIRLAVAA
jgi:P4 family phage/plasmid primase-like protien